MALAVSLNCTLFHKPFSPPNPNRNSPLVSPKQNLHFNHLFPNKKIRWAKESRLVIANGAEKDSSHSSSQDEEVNNLGVKAALSMLKFYKREISPLLPNSCRYIPTCSEYSMAAYKKYGVVKGTVLTAWRLCRCNPLGQEDLASIPQDGLVRQVHRSNEHPQGLKNQSSGSSFC